MIGFHVTLGMSRNSFKRTAKIYLPLGNKREKQKERQRQREADIFGPLTKTQSIEMKRCFHAMHDN